MRRGISLIEVLVSIFVLLFGLLAVVAILPVAGLRIIQTTQADHCAACGQSGLRDVKIRGLCNPHVWLQWDASTDTFEPAVQGDPTVLNYRESFAIDPLGFSETPEDRHARFPADPPAGTRSMRRVTLETLRGDGTRGPMFWGEAERLFGWTDDLTVTTIDEQRPALLEADGVIQWNGDYSWFATVTPEATFEAGGFHETERNRNYRLSVVVVHGRQPWTADAVLPPERTVTAQMLSVGLGGGEVRLSVNIDRLPESLSLRKGRWLMLSGVDNSSSTPRDAFRWYRVVTATDAYQTTEDVDGDGNVDVDEDANGNGMLDPGEDLDGDGNLDIDEDLDGDGTVDDLWARDVSIAGPDWTFGTVCEAVLVDGVLGVYTEAVEL